MTIDSDAARVTAFIAKVRPDLADLSVTVSQQPDRDAFELVAASRGVSGAYRIQTRLTGPELVALPPDAAVAYVAGKIVAHLDVVTRNAR